MGNDLLQYLTIQIYKGSVAVSSSKNIDTV